jgi:hypothetical protein
MHRRALEPVIRGVDQLARERRAKPPLPPSLMATAFLAFANGMQLERLTRPDEVDIEAIQQAASLLAWGATPLEKEGSE